MWHILSVINLRALNVLDTRSKLPYYCMIRGNTVVTVDTDHTIVFRKVSEGRHPFKCPFVPHDHRSPDIAISNISRTLELFYPWSYTRYTRLLRPCLRLLPCVHFIPFSLARGCINVQSCAYRSTRRGDYNCIGLAMSSVRSLPSLDVR